MGMIEAVETAFILGGINVCPATYPYLLPSTSNPADNSSS